MTDEQLVAEHARKFAAQFEGFLKACEIIGRGGALGQLADEAQKRYDELAAKADELAAKHAAADERLAAAKIAVDQAQSQAGIIKAAADGEAGAARKEAMSVLEDARTIIAQERAAALESANASAVRLIADTHASLEDVTAQVAARREALDALNNAVVSQAASLERLKQERSALLQRLQEIAE